MYKNKIQKKNIAYLLLSFSFLVLLSLSASNVYAETCEQKDDKCIDDANLDSTKVAACKVLDTECKDKESDALTLCNDNFLACSAPCGTGKSACADKCTVDMNVCEAAAKGEPSPILNTCDIGDKACKDGCASVDSICITAAGSNAVEIATCTNTQIGCAAQCNDLTNECKSQAASATTPADTSTPSAPPPESISLPNPLGSKVDIKDMVGEVIKISLGFLGSLALLMFVYGGFLWMTSRGKTESIKQGSTTMLWAAIGIVFVFSSYGLLVFILDLIGAA